MTVPRASIDHLSRGLNWLGIALLVLGGLVVVAAIVLTTSIEALVTAASIAALAFAIPGAASFALAFWLEQAAQRAEHKAIAAMQPVAAPESHWGEILRKYSLAIVAVLVAWALRLWLDLYIPNEVPFITFYLAVAVAGWIGGFWPAAVATLLSATITGALYVRPGSEWDVGRLFLLGIFLLVALGIAAILSALHDALARAQQLANEARRTNGARNGDHPLRALAQFAPAALFATDAAQGCTYCNQAWLSLRGRTLTQELGNGWCEGVHAEDLARRRQAFATALATREPQAVAYRLKHADGTYREVRDVVVAHVNGRGQVVGLLGATTELASSASDARPAQPAVEDSSL